MATSSLPVPLSPGDEHGGVGGGHLDDAAEHLADGLGAAGDVLELVAILELVGEQRDLAGELAVVVGALDLDQELLLAEGLLDVVEGAEPHGLHGALDGAVGGHHDDLGGGVRLLDRAQHADAVELPHPQVGEDHVVGALGAHVGALRAVAGLVHLVAGAAQHHRQGGAHVALIIDDQDLGHRSQLSWSCSARYAFSPRCSTSWIWVSSQSACSLLRHQDAGQEVLGGVVALLAAEADPRR